MRALPVSMLVGLAVGAMLTCLTGLITLLFAARVNYSVRPFEKNERWWWGLWRLGWVGAVAAGAAGTNAR